MILASFPKELRNVLDSESVDFAVKAKRNHPV